MDEQKNDTSRRPGTVIEPQPSTLDKIHKVVKGEESQFKHEVNEELKFTGFEQPKEKGFWALVKRHKVRFAVGSFLGVIVLVIAVLVLVSSDQSEKIVIEPQAQQRTVDEQTEVEEQPPEEAEKSLVPETATAEYSLSKGDIQYQLTADGEAWLTRSEREWYDFVQWDSWLFFVSDLERTADEEGVYQGGVLGVEAFNYETRQYLTIAQLEYPQLSIFDGPMYIDGDYLYVRFQAHNGAGGAYRCLLDEQKVCSDMNLFYGGAGQLTILDDTTVIVNAEFADTRSRSQTMKVFNPATGDDTTVANLSTNFGIGSSLAGIADDKLIWISDTSGDVVQAETDPAYDGVKMSQLYAIDLNGATQFLLPAQGFPIANPVLLENEDVALNEIVFVNDTQEVSFDMGQKQFGAVKDRRELEDPAATKTDIRKIVEISSQLDIPDGYVLSTVEN